MTKEDKAKEYADGLNLANHYYEPAKQDFIAGYEAAESNQSALIKAALRFAKDNHKSGFTDDMMYQLFKESIDPANIPLPPPNKQP